LIALAVLAVLVSGAAVRWLAPAGVVVGLALSGTAWTAGLLLFGVTGPWSDCALLVLGRTILGLALARAALPESVFDALPAFARDTLARADSSRPPQPWSWRSSSSTGIRYPERRWDASAIL